MSNLTELINKTIHDIQFNGCTLPETIIRLQFDNIVACAKLEESRERNNAYLESIGTAFGNGGNDRPNVIGDMITEPSLTPDQMVRGEWYVVKLTWDWLIKHDGIKDENVYHLECIDLDTGGYCGDGFFHYEYFNTIRPATKEEVLIYFSYETFTEPADYVNPITN